MSQSWTRIQIQISDERDRRELVAILAANGLEVRVVRERDTNKSPFKRYVEYRGPDPLDAQKIPE